MNTFNFDQVIDRRNTNCAKWDTQAKKYNRNDLIHMSVADMDFRSPDPIINALGGVVEHGIFGYTDLNDAFYSSIQRWMKTKHHVEVPKEWIVFCPRINVASSISVEALTSPDAKIIMNTPAYSPLHDAIIKNNRTILESPLIRQGDRLNINFEYLESIVDDKTEMFILVNPDNPSTRVWSKEELIKVADFCVKNNLFFLVDEIHSDIIAENISFYSSLSLPGKIQNNLIYLSSLTKTFNIPGVIVSYMIVPNEHVRDTIKKSIDRIGMHNPSIFAVAAVEAGYNDCDEWLNAANTYINENETFFRDFILENMPEFKIMPREGTYLLWIDYTALGVTEDILKNWFIEEAGIEVYMGSNFGQAGNGYIRLNLATSRNQLEQALKHMKNAYSKLR